MNGSAGIPTIALQIWDVSANSSCIITEELSMAYYILMVLDIFLSLPSNAAVVWLLIRSKRSPVTSDIFVLNLASSEVAICVIAPIVFIENFGATSPDAITTIYFFTGIGIVGRPMFQSCICVERYLAVVHPIVYMKYKPLRYRLVCLASLWLLTLGFCFAISLKWLEPPMIGTYLSVFAVDSFCSFSILRALKQPQPGDGEREEMGHMKRRAFRTVLIIQVMTIFHYFPMLIVTVLSAISPAKYQMCQMVEIAYDFSIFGNFVHPLFYLSRMWKLPCTKSKCF